MAYLVATCCPGIEEILKKEISDKLKSKCETKRGKAYFDADINKCISNIKCADNIYLYVGGFKCGSTKAHLPFIKENIHSLSVEKKLDKLAKENIVQQKPWKAHFSCSRSGKHTYSRFDAAEYAAQGIKSKNIISADEKNHDVALRLAIENDWAEVWIKLTDSMFRFRGLERNFSSAALRPTISHALIYISKPNKWDVFADLFCGSGTIPSERLFYDYAKILCGDINPEAVDCTVRNLGDTVQVYTWDAKNLPIENETVDVIVTNPPWDKQIIVEDLAFLYEGFLKEANRILKKNGRMVVITDNCKLMTNYSKNLFDVKEIACISIHGTLASIYSLTRI